MRNARRLPLETLQPYLFKPQPAAGSPDLRQLFGNDHPVELEVGFGKGAFLVESCLAKPQGNYLGIEIDYGQTLYVASRLAKRGAKNVRLICGDALPFMREHLPTECLNAIHVYFPDPWWKRRHRKRRVFTAEFTAQCVRVLQTGGHLLLATDVKEYFAVMLKLVNAQPQLLPVESMAGAADPRVLTNFERKAVVEGRSIWRTAFQKVAIVQAPAQPLFFPADVT